MFADLASIHPQICPKTPGRHSLASTANPRPHYQRSSFAYTAKPNLKQSSTAENWLVGPEKNTDSALMEPVPPFRGIRKIADSNPESTENSRTFLIFKSTDVLPAAAHVTVAAVCNGHFRTLNPHRSTLSLSHLLITYFTFVAGG